MRYSLHSIVLKANVEFSNNGQEKDETSKLTKSQNHGTKQQTRKGEIHSITSPVFVHVAIMVSLLMPYHTS